MCSEISIPVAEDLLDRIFGNKEDVITLIKQQRWKEAAKYGDHISYEAATTNEDWWYEQIDSITCVDKQKWNSTSYGNAAMGIFYGSKFPERKDIIDKMKKIFIRDL